jgi:glyoxylase-like metal-dependent hydrolase (beta-lactamase superfamily II)
MEVHPVFGRDYDANVFIVPGRVPTVIDTGTGFHSREVLRRVKEVVDLSAVQQIVLTHEHFDHVGGTPDFLAASGGRARVGAHRDAVVKLKAGQSTFAEMLGGRMPSLDVTLPLQDGMRLTVGDVACTVLSTPGHSPGSLCLYCLEEKVLFSGDTVFAGGGFGRYDFPGGSYAVLVASVQRLASLDVEQMYSGHGPVVEDKGTVHIRHALSNLQMR